MKIELDLKAITIETKEELFELIRSINYRPHLQKKFYEQDAGNSLEWDMLDFIRDYFESVIGLRTKDPDLLNRLGIFVDFINNKLKEIKKTNEIMNKWDED